MTKYCDIHGAVEVPAEQTACTGSIVNFGGVTTCGTVLKATEAELERNRKAKVTPAATPQPPVSLDSPWTELRGRVSQDRTVHVNTDTRARQMAFLASYGMTCNISAAARACDMARSSHFRWLKEDPDYPALFAEAKELAHQVLMDSAVEKATVGWLEPVFHNGQQCGTITKRSDRLHEVLLKGAFREQFSDRIEHTGKDGAPLIPLDVWDSIKKAAADDSDAAG